VTESGRKKLDKSKITQIHQERKKILTETIKKEEQPKPFFLLLKPK